MAVSRRIFIKAGTLAAVAAGVFLKPGVLALGQDLVDQIGAPAVTDPLANYNQATFAQYVNSIFRLRGPAVVDVTLTKVEDTLPVKTSRAGGRESFALFFRGGSVQLPQNTYIVEHAALGTFQLFLVPGGADENGAQAYTAIINRLPYTGGKHSSPGDSRKPLQLKRSTPGPGTQTEGTKPTQRVPQKEPVKPLRKGTREPEGFETNSIDY